MKTWMRLELDLITLHASEPYNSTAFTHLHLRVMGEVKPGGQYLSTLIPSYKYYLTKIAWVNYACGLKNTKTVSGSIKPTDIDARTKFDAHFLH
jgi:hypothetical protein